MYLRKDSEELRVDVERSGFLSHLDQKKNLQNCYKIYSQFLQNLMESSLPFSQSFPKFCGIIPNFLHKCNNISLKLEQCFS